MYIIIAVVLLITNEYLNSGSKGGVHVHPPNPRLERERCLAHVSLKRGCTTFELDDCKTIWGEPD